MSLVFLSILENPWLPVTIVIVFIILYSLHKVAKGMGIL